MKQKPLHHIPSCHFMVTGFFILSLCCCMGSSGARKDPHRPIDAFARVPSYDCCRKEGVLREIRLGSGTYSNRHNSRDERAFGSV
jgi:hypothetical protein